MQSGTKKIITIKSYECGYCEHNPASIYLDVKSSKERFYARVLLLEHCKYGKVLIDTGYSERIYKNGYVSKIYNGIVPTHFEMENHISKRLLEDGIDKDEIKTIILTHLHPDHIGGVKDFPEAKIWMSMACRSLIRNSSVKDLVFKNMIDLEELDRIRVFEPINKSPLNGFTGYDFWGDGSLWLIDLPGHAYGQVGLYIPCEKLFYIVDAAWGRKYMGHTLKKTAAWIQNDYKAYCRTIHKIGKLKGLEIISCHGKEVVLDV